MLFSGTIKRDFDVSDENEKSKGGRPTKFKPEYVNIIKKMCELGAINTEIAEAIGVAYSTLCLWISKHPELAEAMQIGKEASDNRVEHSLYMAALGYERDEEELKVVSMGQGEGSKVERHDVRKWYPPNPTAMIFWLKNRRQDKWRNQPEPDDDDNRADPLTINIQVAEPKADIKVTRGKSGD